ncbi:unnamed protein product [Cuscuta campestris]|uniref:Protein BIG GRAIN 1-like B n=1 Tax=Cuscuta campestris TaxID=132261 RepID=A0A484M0K2_9ASTE|nr:unnamed protein product [Cuscuta campestris]
MSNFERQKCPKEQKYSTFSATLLDEIYRSIDRIDENSNDPRTYTQASRLSLKGDVDGFCKKARFVESWMYQKGIDAPKVHTKGCNRPLSSLLLSSYNDKSDPFFFSSGLSESSSSGLSSEPDLFSTKTSCFNTPRLKQVKTTTTTSQEKSRNSSSRGDVDLMMGIKSKSAALKMYANLKKTKTPVSPGARLTSFLNSIFGGTGVARKGRGSPLAATQTASPPASRSSCLNRTPRMNRSGSKRAVRFDPVGVIVRDDCRPCGHRRIYSRELPAPGNNQENKKSHPAAFSGDISMKSYHNHYKVWKNESWMSAGEEEEEEEEYEDDLSDSSSDLFEIDLRALVGKRRFREELPVYETTHFPDSNRILASSTGLVC